MRIDSVGGNHHERRDGAGYPLGLSGVRNGHSVVSGAVERLLRWYAQRQTAAIREFVVGRRVLDLGAAEAYVAAALADRTGTWACGVDIGAYRRAGVPYVVYDGGRLPFQDASFDTTLLLLTLHHCDAPEVVLDEAIRVTRRRLVVTESVYRTRLERFWLDALDGRVNRFRHDSAMPPALHVRPPQAWARLFETRALSVVATRWLGSALERLVHHPVLWALDVAPEGR
jgi:SAM-dependent methyltransferase